MLVIILLSMRIHSKRFYPFRFSPYYAHALLVSQCLLHVQQVHPPSIDQPQIAQYVHISAFIDRAER
jgi:hypothetical protein